MKPTFLAAFAAVSFFVGCQRGAETPAPEKEGSGATARERKDTPADGRTDVLTFNIGNFPQQVLDSKKPVMVDVFAAECADCQAMDPIVAELATEFRGRAVIGTLDEERNRALVHQYMDLPTHPTFLFFKGGEVVDRVVGSTSKEDLAKRLNALVAELP